MRRYWQGIVISLLVLALTATISFQFIANAHAAKERRGQFCEALPNAAAAGAQALIDIAIQQDIKEGATAAEIERTRKVGDLYIARARELVLADLPTCPQP